MGKKLKRSYGAFEKLAGNLNEVQSMNESHDDNETLHKVEQEWNKEAKACPIATSNAQIGKSFQVVKKLIFFATKTYTQSFIQRKKLLAQKKNKRSHPKTVKTLCGEAGKNFPKGMVQIMIVDKLITR